MSTGADARPRLVVVQHEDGTGPGWWGDWLTGAGLDLDIRHPYAGDPLPAATSGAGLLVLGGAMGPEDDDASPRLPATRDLLADAVAAGVPTFGICLGAELLAVACGGSVRRGVAGPELGVLEIERLPAADDDPVLAALPARSRVLQWHWEEMDTLPPGSVLLARSAAYRHQAFRLGDRAWGLQFHIECDADMIADWTRTDVAALDELGYDAEAVVAATAEILADVEEVWQPFAARFAALALGTLPNADIPQPGTLRTLPLLGQ